MAIKMIDVVEGKKFMLDRGVSDRRAVIGHLRTVLGSFAAKPQWTRFYIGITGDLEARFAGHNGDKAKAGFQLMVPIYAEQAIVMDESFDKLESEAIRTFKMGIVHPTSKQMLLRCENGVGGAQPKTWLYILIG
jgi:predicted GIY-YIG superfamily endonuclease